MRILFATKVRHCDPHVLVYLVRVRRGNTSLSGKSKLGHTVSVHLLGIRRVERSCVSGLFFLLLRLLNRLRWRFLVLSFNFSSFWRKLIKLWSSRLGEKVIFVCLWILRDKWGLV